MWKRLVRTLRHRWLADGASQRAFSIASLDRLTQVVAAGEAGHSGEIRIYVEAGLPLSYLWRVNDIAEITRQRALSIFGKLRVWDTEKNNGVLIYLLLAERRIEVVADRGVNRHVGADTWRNMVTTLASAFKAGQYEEGVTQAVVAVSDVLHLHFPVEAGLDNPDELPNRPILG